MKLGRTLYVTTREKWRAWLEKHHHQEPEIWLVYYRKSTGKPRLDYNVAIEEALCFGWIDSIEKGIDGERFAQRFSPRKPGSNWSEMNKERVRRLIKKGKMTPAGLAVFPYRSDEKFTIPLDIKTLLKKDPVAWRNFQSFPRSYQKIRLGWIDAVRHRPQEFQKRLNYFLKMTAQNKRFGMVQ